MAHSFYLHISEATTHERDLEGLHFSGFVFVEQQNTTDEYGVIVDALNHHGIHAPLHLRGSYAGLYWSSKDNQWILFSDPLGTKPLYYAQLPNGWHISSDYDRLVQEIKAVQPLTFSAKSFYQLLSYGFVLESDTLLNPIKRLPIGFSGTIGTLNNEQKPIPGSTLSTHKIYSLPKIGSSLSLDDAAAQVDILFRAAIKRAFERDAEQSKIPLVSLSGGLDSRMTSWVAHEMGYTNQLNLCFAQKNSLDHTIAQDIAKDLAHKWHFMPLDGGEMLLDLDEVTQHTGGNVVYYGQAHTRRILQEIIEKNSPNTLGMLHTGMLGDVVIGSYLQTTKNPVHFSALSGATSTRFAKELLNHGFKPEYENLEHHKMMLRGLYGMNMGLMSVYAVTDSYSPFYDIDLFNFCLQLPLKLRAEHKLYTYWITQYYPDAANYIWERTRTKITAKSIRIGSKSMPMQTWLWKLAEKIRFGQPTRNPRYMTPLDYWFATHTGLTSQLNNYFNQYLDLIDDAEMRYHINELYTNGNGKEKVQALSIIAAAKRYVS